MIYIYVILSLSLAILMIRINRMKILQWLLRLRARLRIQSLRGAIQEADKDKAETKRKNMVVFNTASGKYEPFQKQLLKNVQMAGKNKNNAKMTEGRLKFKKTKKKLLIQDVRTMEEKSLYVTN